MGGKPCAWAGIGQERRGGVLKDVANLDINCPPGGRVKIFEGRGPSLSMRNRTEKRHFAGGRHFGGALAVWPCLWVSPAVVPTGCLL